ncbi:Uncharacterised protein [Salmonella enterica subsp. enterica serovar Bovismorbificans]|uniref:Uncharacterized protein n=1 Tax=Salmonella enterica subsp. enterica serovar Bovismorbificans TaxID=58097 RepID=A0A655EFH1_SALET|nr:Uncharacterised protein [Salmonella enterica subsp. enterica serovar Bovismorbificans]CNV19798.1 Uncharacterised protein [Salmonella enterica subsp. enterica serovar Bovismorbificans]CPR40684.1 Uncharacterised protein [Salmonella enterica subsp. enterica serovar Bovismorbificans]
MMTLNSASAEGCAVEWGAIAITVPEVGACTGSILPRPRVSAWPRSTRSPTLTHSSPSAPMCCFKGITKRGAKGTWRSGVPFDWVFISGG